jgi:NOL1/NOP2/fmu family ribosome biogenesis protein
VNRKRFEPSHALAMALDRNEVHRYVEFEGDSPQAYAWIRGESVSVGEEMGQGWTLVSIDGCSAGWGKVSGGVLKNHYPKGLRKGSNYKQIRI